MKPKQRHIFSRLLPAVLTMAFLVTASTAFAQSEKSEENGVLHTMPANQTANSGAGMVDVFDANGQSWGTHDFEIAMGLINGSTAGYTIKLTTDIAVDSSVIIAMDANFTLDLNGKTLAYTGSDNYFLMLSSGSIVTFKDDTGNGKITSQVQCTILANGATVVFEGGIYENQNTSNGIALACNSSNITINDGTFYNTNTGASGVLIQNSAVTITGGTFDKTGFELKNLTSASISGGNFKSIDTSGTGFTKVGDLLATDHKFVHTNPTILADPTVPTLYNVTVGHIPFDITASPQSATIAYGASHTLSVEVSDPNGVTYQWYKGIDPVSGATDSTYTLPTDLSTGAHVYHCKITYGASTVSTLNVTITVQQKLVFCDISHPNNLEYGQAVPINLYVNTPDVNGTAYLKKDGATLGQENITSSKRNHTFSHAFPAGEHTVTLEFVPSDTNYKTFTREITVTVGKADQTGFSINEIDTKKYGDPDFDLLTTGGLVGAVTYTSSDTDILEIAGPKAKILKAGTVTITAIRSGNENYNPATATREITIGKANTTISFSSPITRTRYFTGEPQANPVNSDLTITGATYDDVVFTWYADSAGTTEISAPTAIGEYWLKATIHETENLKGPVTATIKLEIKQADVSVVILYNGSYANSPWYSQPVTIQHENGFLVSDSPTGPFAQTFTLDGHGAVAKTLYFKDTTTGYVSAGVNVSVNIDSVPPSFAVNGYGINYGGLNSKNLLTDLSYEIYNINVIVHAIATDTGSGGVKYFYYPDKSPTTTAKTTAELDSLLFWESSAPLTLVGEDDYVVYAFAMDAVGNKSPYICTNIIRIDKTAPVAHFYLSNDVITSSTVSTNIKLNETGTIYYVTMPSTATPPTASGIVNSHNGRINVTSDKINTNVPLYVAGMASNTWYRIYAVGVDEAGNTSALNWIEFCTEKLDQPITINPIGTKTYGDADFELSISGGLGDGAVTFTSSDTDILEITGTTAKILKAGTVTITATKAEDDTYAKETTTFVLTINKASTSIAFNTAEITRYFTGVPQPLPTSDDLTLINASFSDVVFAWYSDVDLNNLTIPPANVGVYWLKATIPETDNFASSFAVQKVTVAYASLNPTIKYNGSTTNAEAYNTDVTITADGYYISDSPSGSFDLQYLLSSEGVHTKTLYFKDDDTGYISAGKNVSVTIDKTAPELTLEPSQTTARTITQKFQTDEEGTVYFLLCDPLDSVTGHYDIIDAEDAITIDVSSDDVGQELSIVFSDLMPNTKYSLYAVQVDKAGNLSSAWSMPLTTPKLDQPITIDLIGTKTYGDADFNLSINGGLRGGAVTFTSSDTDILEITGTTAKILKAGTVTITATKAEDDTYVKATATLELTIAKKALTITAENIQITKNEPMLNEYFNLNIVGLVNRDRLSSILFDLIDYTQQIPQIAGTYPISISNAIITNSDNYDITYVNGTLTVVGDPHTVTVTNGTGGGTYREGQTVSITANNRTGFTFKDWTAEGVTLSSPTSKTITFTMPDNAVTLTANYTANATSGGGGYTPSTPTTPSTVTSTVGVSDTNATITVSGNVANVTYGETTLVAGRDYTITNGQLVIKTDVLAELSAFEKSAEVEITLANGEKITHSIRRTDTPRLANPVETNTAITFNFAGYGHNPRTIQLLQGSNVVTELRIISDFNTKDGKLTLDKKAIASLEDGSYTFTVGFDTGASLNLTLIKKGSQITIVRSDLNIFSITGGKAPSSLDCLKMLEMYVADKSSTGENFDLNADGKFDTQDILLLLEFVVS